MMVAMNRQLPCAMKQYFLIFYGVVLACGGSVVLAQNSGTVSVPEFRVVGYLPDYRLTAFELNSSSGLTDLIIFSAEPRADGSIDLRRLQNCPWSKLNDFKSKNRVRLILSVGGWERSKNFATVAASKELRTQFAKSLIQLAQEKDLDGIDLDWEHPNGTTEQQAYGQLLSELQSAFQPHRLNLTVTIAAWQRLPKSAIDAVDGVQVMAYDHDQEHSTLAGAQRDILALLDAGIPARKLVLGLPFYGRDVETREAVTYREIVAKFAPTPEVDRLDRLYFNGPETIRKKVELAIESRLAGVMVWELGQDAPAEQSLLRVINRAVSQRAKLGEK